MYFSQLTFSNLRNIQSLDDFFPDPGFNFIVGENGSGKTTVLEGIYLLIYGKSFRTTTRSHVITEGSSESILHGKFQNSLKKYHCGVHLFENNQIKCRIDQETQRGFTELIQMLPLQLMNNDSFQLLNGGPDARRAFIDRGLFHVKHNFHEVWKKFMRALQQRNNALKQKAPVAEIEAWNEIYVETAEQLEQMRQEYISDLMSFSNQIFSQNSDFTDVKAVYQRGWSEEESLADLLKQNLYRDIAQGYTTNGPQRSDWKITYHSKKAKEHLSRGQQKLFLALLLIFQLQHIEAETKKKGIVLIDDLFSELDEHRAGEILLTIQNMGFQTFITMIFKLPSLEKYSHRMFHVKHGEIFAEEACL